MSWADRVRGVSKCDVPDAVPPADSASNPKQPVEHEINTSQGEKRLTASYMSSAANETLFQGDVVMEDVDGKGWEKYSKVKNNKFRKTKSCTPPNNHSMDDEEPDNLVTREEPVGKLDVEREIDVAQFDQNGETLVDVSWVSKYVCLLFDCSLRKYDFHKMQYPEAVPQNVDSEGDDIGDEDTEIDNELKECYERALEQWEEEETQLVHQLEDISLQNVPSGPEYEDFEHENEEKSSSARQSLEVNTENSPESAVTNGDVYTKEMMDNFDFGANWADLVEKEEEDQKTYNRDPSRALIIHERLSSPSRTRWLDSSYYIHIAFCAAIISFRMVCAFQFLGREEMASWRETAEGARVSSKGIGGNHVETEKSGAEGKIAPNPYLQLLLAALFKIQEVRRWKNEILSQRKSAYELKLTQAEDKRKEHLRNIVKKAHEEENKVNEIAFIMTLEAQNKRAEMKSKHEVYEARKQEIEVSLEEKTRYCSWWKPSGVLQEVRLKKLEESRALEEAAKERRKNMEQEKENRLTEMQAKRESNMQRIQALQVARDQERLEATKKREE